MCEIKEAYYLAAKTSSEGENKWLPLVHHLLDTAGVMDYLLKNWIPDALYDELGVTKEKCRKICRFLALVHDIGKATPVFQSRILKRLPEVRFNLEKHGLDMSGSFANEKETPHAHAGALLLRTFGCPESLAVVVGAHHGKPESDEALLIEPLDEIKSYKSNYGKRGSKWEELQNNIYRWALITAEYEISDEPKVDLTEMSQMIFTGLLIMADWIASNQRYFPLIDIDDECMFYSDDRTSKAMKRLELPDPCYMSEHWKYKDFFVERFGFEPNSIQEAIHSIAENMKAPGLMILEAPMGMGKTEAALAAAEIIINKFKLGGIAFFLPSQATSNAMFERLTKWLDSQPDIDHSSVQLAHSNAELNSGFSRFEQGYVQIDDENPNGYKTLTAHSFFRGRKTNLLANVVVGTVDQLLMASLKQKHVMLRHLGLTGKVIVIDECHAYDAYMNMYLERTLQWLSAYHIPVILLSATLPGSKRKALLQAYAGKATCEDKKITANDEYPIISWTSTKQIHQKKIELTEGHRSVKLIKKTQDEALKEIENAINAGGCVGVIVNTVRRVDELYNAINEKITNAKILVDHSQFLILDRNEAEECIKQCVGKTSTEEDRKNTIVIGSQVLEQSLDIDFDLLVTDLCPIDLLMQRLGREQRHYRKRPEQLREAKCILLNCDEDKLEEGAKFIYGEYLLKRTLRRLPDHINLPDDISKLIGDVYDGKPEEDLKKCFEENNMHIKKQQSKAKAFRLEEPCYDEFESSIRGMLDGNVTFTEPQARAAVRDGDPSIEVIVLKWNGNNDAMIISGNDRGTVIEMNSEPSTDEAKKIALQRLKLPQFFAAPWNMEQTIRELEEKTQKLVPEWLHNPLLEGELFLFLNNNFEGKIIGHILIYDSKKGLTYRKENDER